MKYNSITSITGKEQDPHFLKEPTITEYKRLIKAFAEWLRLLNFDKTTRTTAPRQIQEFLSWLESQQITEIASVTRQTIAQYFTYLIKRKNQRKGGRLSKNSLRSYLTNLRRLARYLRESGLESFDTGIQIKGKLQNIKEILTKEEITTLYEATESDILGMRDRAILAVYYGCGLRRSEGLNLDVKDILLDRNLLYVRKGKNYKERYVPISAGVREDLKNYLEYARPILLKRATNAFFISSEGRRITGNTMLNRLNQIKEKAGIEKEAGLHTLRHSIATHLLQSGMELEKIQQFLGHSTLESTQIYTHIIHERK